MAHPDQEISSLPAENGEAQTSGPAIMRLVQDQLLEARSLKNSLESRASAVIASAGTLVTLLFALVALITKTQRNSIPLASRFLIGAALVAFLVAAVLSILVLRPREYGAVSEKTLDDLTDESSYGAPASVGEPVIAAGIVKLISRARAANKTKARFLIASVIAEVVAVMVLGLAIGAILALS